MAVTSFCSSHNCRPFAHNLTTASLHDGSTAQSRPWHKANAEANKKTRTTAERPQQPHADHHEMWIEMRCAIAASRESATWYARY